jgi:hypothetical protein
MNIFTISVDGNYFMNIKKNPVISQINKKYIELGKFEDAIHIIRNLWLPACIIEYLEDRVTTLKHQISELEKSLEN